MRLLKFLLAAVIGLAAASPLPAAHAQEGYSQAELDQMLAPVALYPDALLSQLLLAATRPLEVVEAARWSRANPGLQGNDAVLAVENESWDPSVKSLVAFPQLLARMDENLEWTKALGYAFFVQEPVVMETIQELRRRAQAAGQLMADDRMRVIDDGQAIVLEPVAPEVVYVPYYDPWIVYGPWRWTAYPPVAWAPWPGYGTVRRPGMPPGFWWGPGAGVSATLMFGSVDWVHRRVRVPVHPRYSRPVQMHRDPPARRRFAPQAPAPAPRAEPRPQPRAERTHPRRESRPDISRPEPARQAPAAPAFVNPAPRLQQRPAPASQPAPAAPARSAPTRIERTPRTDAARTERAPQGMPVRIEPQRAQPAPATAPQRARASAPNGPQRVAPPTRTLPERVDPNRQERAPAPAARDARDNAPRGGVRP